MSPDRDHRVRNDSPRMWRMVREPETAPEDSVVPLPLVPKSVPQKPL